MRRKVYLISGIVLALLTLMPSCSTQKNTWGTRTFHAMKTKYNIRFNGELSYDEGIKAIDNANHDDFSALIPLYSVSNHNAAQAASSQMDRTIEKCRKCIKLHSIKAKPKPNPKKRNDPKYKAWLQQEEFNREMKQAWILLGKAEFHKGDFLGSIGTFNYIIRHFAYDKDMVAQCQLWEVRAYGEMGWLYEADDLFRKVMQDDLSLRNAWLYSAVGADLRLKQEQYSDAVPFLKIAMPDEKRAQRTRYLYLLAQLSERNGDNRLAADYYKRVIKTSPPAEMDFNARLHKTELSGNVRSLLKMAKQPKHKDRLDYIYGSVGNIYLHKKDTAKALEYYALAAEKSTQGGLQKASVLVMAGDMYYDRRDYASAAPCYKDAVNIISAESPDYQRIRKRAETLDLLVTEQNVVVLQDSLQALSKLSEEEQLKVAEKIIADLEKAEKEEAEKAAQAAREAERNGGLQSVNTANMLGGGGGTADWYFYNQSLLRQGKQEFIRRWGNRSLEDNWRRKIKQTTIVSPIDNDSLSIETDSLGVDSTLQQTQVVSDTKNPQYYLQQIPKTPEQLALSDTMIATALYNMVCIYEDKVEDNVLAEETFEELNRRFPADEHLAELYYRRYLNNLKQKKMAEAELARQQLVTRFPDSRQAQTASNPDYFMQLERAALEQDSVYEAAYTAFRKNDFAEVKRIKQYAEDNYPLGKLMPKFLFLNAIAVAKTEEQSAFVEALRDMVRRYPESETGAMAKDMLAMMNEGLESQNGDNSSLLDRRGEMAQELDSALMEQTFSVERNERSNLFILVHGDEKTLNNLLYEVALFNFSQFLIKDFDLKLIPVFDVTNGALQVSGFETYDEALWYIGLLKQNADMQALLNKDNARLIPITESNYPLLNTRFTIDEYEDFRQQNGL